jgi:hypothetical protein
MLPVPPGSAADKVISRQADAGRTVAYGHPQPEPPRRSAFSTAFTATFGVLTALVVLVILGNWMSSTDGQSAADSGDSGTDTSAAAADSNSGEETSGTGPGDCSFNTVTEAHPLKQTVEATVTPDCPTAAPYAQRITIEMQQFVNTVGWDPVQQETADTISPSSDYITSASLSTGCLPGLWRGHFTVRYQEEEGGDWQTMPIKGGANTPEMTLDE